jgi:hypothetical protein
MFPCSRIRQRFLSINHMKKRTTHTLSRTESPQIVHPADPCQLSSLVYASQGTCRTITSPEWAAAALNIVGRAAPAKSLALPRISPSTSPSPRPTKGTFQRHLVLDGGCWLQPDTKQTPIAIHEDPACTTPTRDTFPGPRSRYIRQLSVWR